MVRVRERVRVRVSVRVRVRVGVVRGHVHQLRELLERGHLVRVES